MMFEGPEFPKPLDETVFNDWLEDGRQQMLRYNFLLIVWNELEREYLPIYVEEREKIEEYEKYPGVLGHESLVAAYALYSESRLT